MFEDILYEASEGIARITINLPEKRNALSLKTMRELTRALEQARDDPEVRVIVLTGAGDKAFCAGADISDFKPRSALENREAYQAYANLCKVFPTLGKPVIAAVNGLALAGGCGLALSADITIAADTARFGLPEINVGIWSMMASAVLSRVVGRKKALELLLTGDTIDAYEAERLGMVNRVVPAEKLREEVDELARRLAAKSPAVMRLGRDAFYAIQDMEFNKAIDYLRDMLVVVLTTEDSQEGVRAFLEKRKPQWKGR